MRKTTFPKVVSTAIVCYVFWLLVSGGLVGIFKGQPDAPILIAGALASIIIGAFTGRFFIHKKAFFLWNPKRFVMLIIYAFVFLWELLKANIDVAIRSFRMLPEKSGIVKIPVDLTSEYAMSMLANSITLTPGTMTMDIAEENGQIYYYVHWINVTEEDGKKAGEKIKGTFEKWIRRIWE